MRTGYNKRGKEPVFSRGNGAGLILALVLTLTAFAAGQTPRISISSRVDKSSITIGDLILYTVEVSHNSDVLIELPGSGANLGQFHIRDYRIGEPAIQDGKRITTAEYTISTFFTGNFEIPPLTIGYILPGDSTLRQLSTEAIPITVESMLPSEAGDIRDIKPPVKIPWTLSELLPWIVGGGLLLAVGTGFLLYYLRRKRGGGPFAGKREPDRPPHEIAREALDLLRNGDLLKKGKVKLYYIRLSEIVRRYFQGRYFIPALEMTTTELMTGLPFTEMDNESFGQTGDLLQTCDLIKFAKMIPPEETHGSLLESAYTIIDRTQVIIEVPESGEGEGEGTDASDKESVRVINGEAGPAPAVEAEEGEK
jgi:hypothetical protein